MTDKYKNFEELAANEQEGSDFQVRFRTRRGPMAVIAPHGGGIEPGTSELADAIANADLSFYAFEGIKKAANRVLHITSGRFDDKNNICNRGQSGKGVQLELSHGLRALLFRTLDKSGRQHPTEQFGRFVNAVRRGILPTP